jgi:hypothetical protein
MPRSWNLSVFGVLFLVVLGLALPSLTTRVLRNPHGGWDGWAIWNTHARVLYRIGPDWKNQIQYTFHGDYPELAPSLAARFWRYVTHEVPLAGSVAGLILGLSGIAVLIASLSHLKRKRLGLVMGVMLLGTPNYLDLASAQYADVPLSFYFLASIALVCLYAQSAHRERSIMVLAGFMAGCAGWTKNEGLLWIVALSGALLLPVVFRREEISERFLPFAAGLLIPLAVILTFKLTVTAHNDIVASQKYETMMKNLTDPVRYSAIFRHFVKVGQTFGAWSVKPWLPFIFFIAVRGIDRRLFRNRGLMTGLLTLAIVLTGYFVVYLNTPLDLQVHLVSSFDRLSIHLWPSLLLLLGLAMNADQPKEALEQSP